MSALRDFLSYIIESIRSQFWIRPALIGLLLLGFIPIMEHTGETWFRWFARVGLTGASRVESAREILAAISTATMTVVGVLFSITMVVLQQVSVQYSPRVIEGFIRSPLTQIVLGVYIGTFGYCVLLLKNLEDVASTPVGLENHPSVPLAILLAFVCLILLIFYIHHIGKSVESHYIVSNIARETLDALDDIQKNVRIALLKNPELPDEHLATTCPIFAHRSGYLKEIALWHFRRRFRSIAPWRVRLYVMPGDYIHVGMRLGEIESSREMSESQKKPFTDCLK